VAAQNLAAAQHIRDIEKVRVDKDDLSKLDFGRIDLDTDELDLALRRAESEVAMAQAACSASLMMACNTAGLDQSVLDAASPLPETAVAGALDQRPSIIAGRIEQKALGQDAELAHNRRIPDLTFGVDYLFDNFVASGNLHQQLMFSVGLPLPFFDRGDHDSAASRATAKALEADEHATLRDAKGQVEGLVAQQKSLAETLHKLETEAVPKSTTIITQTQKAFDLGQTRLPDLLLAQRSHRDLLLEVLETRFDLFTARAQLRQLLGLDDAAAREAAQQRKR
jgi:outer membrane protein TolC